MALTEADLAVLAEVGFTADSDKHYDIIHKLGEGFAELEIDVAQITGGMPLLTAHMGSGKVVMVIEKDAADDEVNFGTNEGIIAGIGD